MASLRVPLGWVLGGLLAIAAVVAIIIGGGGQQGHRHHPLHQQQQLFASGSDESPRAPQQSPPPPHQHQEQAGFLTSLLGPNMTVEAFWQEHWQHKPLIIKRGAAMGPTFYDAFPVVRGADLQDILATCRPHVGRHGQPATDWKIVKQELGPDGVARAGDAPPFPTGPCAGERKTVEDQWCRVAHAADAFAKGFSLVINMVQDKAPRALQLVEGFQRETGMQTSVNLYWSPMGSQAFDIHYDIREVFALQVR